MTDLSLREYVDMRLEELDKRYSNRFVSQEMAIGKAEDSLRERLASMNEFRAAMNDQSKHFITRAEHDKLDNELRVLQRDKANLDGRISVTVIAASTIVSFIISGTLLVLAHFWQKT